MFGSDPGGRPHLHDLLRWFNPSLQHGVPVYARLDEEKLCPCYLRVEVGGNQVTNPQALDGLAENIEALDSDSFAEKVGRTCRRRGIGIIFRGNLPQFLAQHGVGALLDLLEQNGVTDVQIIRVESGSIKLTLSLPEDQAERLSWLADSGALDRFGLVSCKYVPLEHEATVPGSDLEGYHSYLVQRARFLLGDPRVPVRLDAEQLASETLRSAYGTAETELSDDVTRAEQLARLEKIQDRLLVDSLEKPSIGQPPAQQAKEPPIAPGGTTMPTEAAREVTRLLGEVAAGNEGAKPALFAHVYEELHAMASPRMWRERPDHSSGATGLVHEVYLRLLGGRQVFTKGRPYFFAAAARAMHQLLREHARKRKCRPEGRVDPEGQSLLDQVAEEVEDTFKLDLLDLMEALDDLKTTGEHGERRHDVVRLRVWGGLTYPEIAGELGVSVATVERDWQAARAWLYGRLKGGRTHE
jgi:RNA polymerase sigma factor (TIGR02999 family)